MKRHPLRSRSRQRPAKALRRGPRIARAHIGALPVETPPDILASRHSPNVTNFVTIVSMLAKQDPSRIIPLTPPAQRCPKRFTAMQTHLVDARTHTNNNTTLNFDGGNSVITGAYTEMTARRAAHRRRLMIQRVPQPVLIMDKAGKPMRVDLRTLEHYMGFDEFRVVNIVSSGRVSEKKLNLARIYRAFPEHTQYQPQSFPALLYRLTRESCPGLTHDCSTHIFCSGKNVIMGLRDVEQVHIAQLFLLHLVKDFEDPHAPVKASERFAYRLHQLMESAKEQTQFSRRFLAPNEVNNPSQYEALAGRVSSGGALPGQTSKFLTMALQLADEDVMKISERVPHASGEDDDDEGEDGDDPMLDALLQEIGF